MDSFELGRMAWETVNSVAVPVTLSCHFMHDQHDYKTATTCFFRMLWAALLTL